MDRHSHLDSTPVSHQLPFPFNIASRIWRRLWNGIISCQNDSPTSGPRRPLTPSPSPSDEETPSSSPSCRPVPYDHVSSLTDVDYLRGSINRDGLSQRGYLNKLRVVSTDIHTRRSSVDSYYDMFDDRVGRQSSHLPCLPDFSIIGSPNNSLADSIWLGLQQLGIYTVTEIQEPIHATSCPPPSTEITESSVQGTLDECLLSARAQPLPRNTLSPEIKPFMPSSLPRSSLSGSQESLIATSYPSPSTESMPEGLSSPRSLQEQSPPARKGHPLPRNSFSRAMGLFMPSTPSLCSSDADTSQNASPEDNNSDIDTLPSPRPRLPSFGWTQHRGHWLKNRWLSQTASLPLTPDLPESQVMIPNHQGQSASVSASGDSDETQMQSSRGRSREASSDEYNSSIQSPRLSFMSENIRCRQSGSFLSFIPFLPLTLATGTVA
ncbi:hypothetical protein N7520_004727 [Penicillium odoratum]|uniref:uncharacterized protein n=1 Tax=Penicillium odoratum TaxID=1167516 RepID=UPI0025496344|nr:uncharacterized protein N7520_004727 [Penicillium odoratum]KAJ5765168.1 hypothetical protein N7520_004727 [Penicillium odoratum]